MWRSVVWYVVISVPDKHTTPYQGSSSTLQVQKTHPLRCWYLPTKKHGVISQETWIKVFNAFNIQNPYPLFQWHHFNWVFPLCKTVLPIPSDTSTRYKWGLHFCIKTKHLMMMASIETGSVWIVLINKGCTRRNTECVFNVILYTTERIESKGLVCVTSDLTRQSLNFYLMFYWISTSSFFNFHLRFYWISTSSLIELLPQVLLNFYLKFYWISISSLIEFLPQVLLNFYLKFFLISTSDFIEFLLQVWLNFYLKFDWISTSDFIEFLPQVWLNFYLKFDWISTSDFIEFLLQVWLNFYLKFYRISTSSCIEFLPEVLLICLCNSKKKQPQFSTEHEMNLSCKKSTVCFFCETKTEFLRIKSGFKYFNFSCVRSILKGVYAFITHKLVTLSPVKSKSTRHTVYKGKTGVLKLLNPCTTFCCVHQHCRKISERGPLWNLVKMVPLRTLPIHYPPFIQPFDTT